MLEKNVVANLAIFLQVIENFGNKNWCYFGNILTTAQKFLNSLAKMVVANLAIFWQQPENFEKHLKKMFFEP